MLRRIGKIIWGIVLLTGGVLLGTGLYFIFSGQIKMTGDMAFGVIISMIGCPMFVYTGLNFIFNKNAVMP